jgi:hypothetical protein
MMAFVIALCRLSSGDGKKLSLLRWAPRDQRGHELIVTSRIFLAHF